MVLVNAGCLMVEVFTSSLLDRSYMPVRLGSSLTAFVFGSTKS